MRQPPFGPSASSSAAKRVEVKIATLQRLANIARLRAELLCAGPPPRFPQLHAIEEDAPLRLRQLQVQDLTDILYRNMFHRGCLENLILSHDNAWAEHLG
ncbi:MAG: hypothetical protein EBY30_14530 [Rhodospirillales bacterium]|nr:hypothetical protein [Rhodospirillales bacterium]